MLLTDLEGQCRAREDLIADKLAFLRALPRLGHDRGRAFDRTVAPCDPDNASGLQQRVQPPARPARPDVDVPGRTRRAAPASTTQPAPRRPAERDQLVHVRPPPPGTAAGAARRAGAGHESPGSWRLDELRRPARGCTTRRPGQQPPSCCWTAPRRGRRRPRYEHRGSPAAILAVLILRERYGVVPIERVGRSRRLTAMATRSALPSDLRHRAAAYALIDLLATWSAHKRAIVVEHLLLRPKFPGDALYPACYRRARVHVRAAATRTRIPSASPT